ncbi:hypothetical protein T10_10780 [Trichinella papuae]|uniref:Uncharacterized protein n=1 Tax=Trichinella papuae TaxID=268474 RepID=A0A0V1LZ24_9BILA|nr:hypothetical protein T10_10780 [Trichinella papuae]
MHAKLFGGKLPHARQNPAVLDFVERKRHGEEKKPLWLIGYNPPGVRKWKGTKLDWGKPPQDGQNSGGVDFGERKRHGGERKPPMLFR